MIPKNWLVVCLGSLSNSFRIDHLIKTDATLQRFDNFNEMPVLFGISFAGKCFVFIYFVQQFKKEVNIFFLPNNHLHNLNPITK